MPPRMGLPANEFVHAAKFTGIFLKGKKNLKYQHSGKKKKKMSFLKSGTWDAGTKEGMLGRHFCGSSLRCCAAETSLGSFLLPLYYSLTKLFISWKKNFLFKKINK